MNEAPNSETLRQVVVAALEDIKAKDIVVMDVKHLTAIADFMIVASGESARQTKALARNVTEKAKAAGAQVMGVEGEEAGDWILVDLGSVIVHIMHPAVRAYYNLEELWGASPSRARRNAP
ncbi:ribosome silencing factor [Thiobacter aerophilum]|uniref:Ribosomal silencing factor RsfS n=1 Tax=Thiobacter aerophilum TaxID=3121275 RepID=A0ABV0ECM6_9BURK